MSYLKTISRQYNVSAKRGGRIRFSGYIHAVEGTILGGACGRLRVRLDGVKKTVRLHPTWCVEYL